MTRQETANTLLILKAAYPQFYRNMDNDEARAAMNLWSDMFANEKLEVVKMALYRLIETHGGYPPSIADVKRMIRELNAAALSEPTNEELWHILRTGVADGLNGAKEYFEKLPPVLKRYCQSPQWFRDHAAHDPQTLDTVDKGLFMKQIDSMKGRMEFESALPVGFRAYLMQQKNGKVLGDGQADIGPSGSSSGV